MPVLAFAVINILCSVPTDVSMDPTSLNPKSVLDGSNSQRPTRETRLSQTLEIQKQNKQAQEQNLPKKQADPTTCQLFEFKHSCLDGSSNWFMGQGYYGSLLFQLTRYPQDIQELDAYLFHPRHLDCALFRVVLFEKLRTDLKKSSEFSLLDAGFVLILPLLNELKWLALIIRRVSIAPDKIKVSRSAVIIINGRSKYSNTDICANSLQSYIYSRLPEFARNVVKTYLNALKSEANLVDLSNVSTNTPVDYSAPLLNFQMLEKILTNPFLFYIQFDENSTRIKQLSELYLQTKGKGEQIDEQLKQQEFMFYTQEPILAERELKLQEKDKICQQVKTILSEINLELVKIYYDTYDRKEGKNPLRVISVIQFLQALFYEIVLEFQTFNVIGTETLMTNNSYRFSSFQDLILNLVVHLKTRNGHHNVEDILASKNAVQELINFIEENNLAHSHTRNKELKKIIKFCIANMLLGEPFCLIPTISYVLYKTELMNKFNIFILFRYLLIIRRLISRNIYIDDNIWFEQTKKYRNKYCEAIKPYKLVNYETFLKRWEEQQNQGFFPRIYELIFSGYNNKTEFKILERVYLNLGKIYNEMNKVSKEVKQAVNGFAVN